MNLTITKHKLAQALFTTSVSGSIHINNVNFISICSIEREDGSGHSFNVTGYVVDNDGWTQKTIHVTTVD